jgi:hypothetical protein
MSTATKIECAYRGEVGWLQAAGKLFIRRVLEYEAGVARLSLLTMNDLPAL